MQREFVYAMMKFLLQIEGNYICVEQTSDELEL